jgi:hypothetical protein
MGRVTGGTTIYSIPWIEFDVSATVPAGRTQAYLRWTVASGSSIDYVDINTRASASATGQTRVTVNQMISVDAPALINFGSGVPGDTLPVNATVTVTTNNTTGYILTVGGSAMTSTTTSNTISQSNITVSVESGPAITMPTTLSPTQIASSNSMTPEGGHPWSVDLSLAVPFVDSATYRGTVTWVATTTTR